MHKLSRRIYWSWVVSVVLCLGLLASCKPKAPVEEPTTNDSIEIIEEPEAKIEVPVEQAVASLPELDLDVWYRVDNGAKSAYVIVDNQTDDTAEGRFYSLAEGPIAPLHTFKSTVSRRSVVVVVDSIEEKYSRRKLSHSLVATAYEAPTYTSRIDPRYRHPTYAVGMVPDVTYGYAQGYWTENGNFADKGYARIVLEGIRKSFSMRDLPLQLDLYRPNGIQGPKPLILFLHGGAFYVGDRHDEAIVSWCRYFASLGYVTASMDYRMGFLPAKDDIERTGYMAVQDAHAAMRYLVAHADEYGIDPDQLYAAGTSAGSITALNLAFMRDDNRPQASYGGDKSGLFRRGDHTDLGSIASSGNDINVDFHIRAVANMWGAISDLSILKNSKTAIISFHGDADQLVPYDRGYPFSDISEGFGQRLFAEMFGSKQIDQQARRLGLRSSFFSFPGESHAFHIDEDKHINKNWYFIRDSITTFFYKDMVPVRASIQSDDKKRYNINLGESVDSVDWKVEGGFIVRHSTRGIRVLWRADEDKHSITASGFYKNGLGWVDRKKVEMTKQMNLTDQVDPAEQAAASAAAAVTAAEKRKIEERQAAAAAAAAEAATDETETVADEANPAAEPQPETTESEPIGTPI